MFLTTERLTFHKFQANEFDLYFQLMGNSRVMELISGRAFTENETRQKFEKLLAIGQKYTQLGYYAIRRKQDGLYIGLGKLVPIENNETEIGYALLPEFWGMGYGSEISTALVDFAQKDDLIKTLTAIIDPANTASKKILEKCSFELIETTEMDGLPAAIYKLLIIG